MIDDDACRYLSRGVMGRRNPLDANERVVRTAAGSDGN